MNPDDDRWSDKMKQSTQEQYKRVLESQIQEKREKRVAEERREAGRAKKEEV